MGLYISGHPMPQPRNSYEAFKLLNDPKPSKNLVTVTYTDTSPEAKQIYKNTVKGMGLNYGGVLLGGTATILAHMASEKLFPKLANKPPYILLAGGLASLATTIYGLILSFSGMKKMKSTQRSYVYQNAEIYATESSGTAGPNPNRVADFTELT